MRTDVVWDWKLDEMVSVKLEGGRGGLTDGK
jgi:hypothetical protein